MQYNSITKSFVIDTVGVGDPRLDEQEILGSVRSLVRNAARGVNAVVVVMKMARVPEASRANIYVLERLFSTRHLKSGILVLTHWDGDIGEEEESLSRWMAGDQEIQDMIGRFAKVILTNNQPTGRGAYPESRKKCLEELLEFINQKVWKIQPRPVNTLELVVDLLRTFGTFLWQRTLRVKDFVQKMGDEAVFGIPTYCGECTICYEDIKMEDCAHLPCNHSFHSVCLLEQDRCPVCREAFCVDDVYSFDDLFSQMTRQEN